MFKITLTGTLTRNPTLRTVNWNGEEHNVADIRLAVEYEGPTSGKTYRQFYQTSAWDEDAINAMAGLTKGDEVYIEAPWLSASSWINQETGEIGVNLDLRHAKIWLNEEENPVDVSVVAAQDTDDEDVPY